MILFCAKSKNSTGKKYVRKCREETLGLGQVFRPAGKIPRMFSDIRQSYLISFYPMCTCMREMRYVIACDCIYRMPQMRDISCDKCDIGRMRQIRYLSHSDIASLIPHPHLLLMITPPSLPTRRLQRIDAEARAAAAGDGRRRIVGALGALLFH